MFQPLQINFKKKKKGNDRQQVVKETKEDTERNKSQLCGKDTGHKQTRMRVHVK